MKTQINDLIDFHAHIIPKADHGSDGIECTKKQLELLSCIGIKKVVATPHFYAHKTTLNDFLRLREKGVEDMKHVLSETSPLVYPAAEVLLIRDLDKMDGLEKLCIEGTKTILIELPFCEFDEKLEETLLNIRRFGLNPIVVHIERYDKKTVKRIASLNFPCQINASAVTSLMSRRFLMPFVLNGNVWALGTDIHGADESVAADYRKACKKIDFAMDRITSLSSDLLYGGRPIN